MKRQIQTHIASMFRHLDSKRVQRKIESIVTDARPPEYFDNDDIFDRLQSIYTGPHGEYLYDSFSTWHRGVTRATKLLRLPRLPSERAAVLEIGCGDGMTAAALASYGHDVLVADIDDWRDPRALNLSMYKNDLSKRFLLSDDQFSFVYSFNAFEHFPDPEITFKEAVRVCKPGGHLYFEFGPIFAGPWGLHAYRSLNMPYPQHLFSKSFLAKKLSGVKLYDLGTERNQLQWCNQWTVSQFEKLWADDRCEMVFLTRNTQKSYLNVVLEYPAAFRQRGLTYDDLITHNITVCLLKK